MTTHFLQYWEPTQIDYALRDVDKTDHAGSGQYLRMKVKPGDKVWIITVRSPGELVTIGKILVGEIVNRREAARRFGEKNVWNAEHHIVAETGAEEKTREVSLMDVAAQLRFQGEKDRLTITGGLIKAQQLQSIRKLSAASAALLESKWNTTELPSAPELEQQISKSGAGYGDPETNRKVERAAVSFVTEWYEGRGWKVETVEAMKCGYDLSCTKN